MAEIRDTLSESSTLVDCIVSDDATSRIEPCGFVNDYILVDVAAHTTPCGFIDYYALLSVAKTASNEEILTKVAVRQAELISRRDELPTTEMATASFHAAALPYLEIKCILANDGARAFYDEMYADHACEKRVAEYLDDPGQLDRVLEHQRKHAEEKLVSIQVRAESCLLMGILSIIAILCHQFGMAKALLFSSLPFQVAGVLFTRRMVSSG